MTLTPKAQAAVSAAISGIAGFISWLSTVPPETQASLLGQIVNACPVGWRPDIGLIAKLVSMLGAVYATYSASKSGPSKPAPVNTDIGKS